MKLINNRYKVIRILEQNYHVTSYLVADIMKNLELEAFYILNTNSIAEGTINYLKEEFISLRNINTSGIVNLKQFGLITDIDGHKVKKPDYYYTTEYFESDGDILGLTNKLNDEEMFDLAAELCSIVNTLHLKGIIYEIIRPENIYYSRVGGKVRVKLKDLVTLEIEKIGFWKSGTRVPMYRAPELQRGAAGTRASDIYSLGMVFLQIFQLESIRALSVSTSSLKLMENRELQRHSFLGIVEKMVERNPERRYENIKALVEDINSMLCKAYKAFELEDLEKLNLNTKLTGMDFARHEVMKALGSMNKGEPGFRVIGLHGETGVGKTRLLRELEYSIYMQKCPVYSAYNNSEIVDNSRVPSDILKKLISECSEELLNKYREELAEFIPQLGDSKNTSEVISSVGEKDKYRLIHRLRSFMIDYTREEPVVLLIDNLHFESSFFIELIETMYANSTGKILLIFTYDDAESIINSKFNNMLSILKDGGAYLSIKVNPLSEEETVAMVKNIMCAPKPLVRFTKRIYTQTYGNPLFVEEVIKKLFLKRDIYIDKETGVWSTDYNMEDIPIPISLEHAMVNQMKELDSKSFKVIEVISIFNNAVSIDTISRVLQWNIKEIEPIITELIEKAMISRKINDKGFVFDFCNRVQKRLIYRRIEETIRKSMHKYVAYLLEESFDTEDRENREELIYHYEMAEVKDKVIKYCIENADRFERLNITEAVIKNLKKAITMFDADIPEPQAVELFLRLGDIFKEEGDIKRAIDNYEKAEQMAAASESYKLQIDALCKMAFVLYNRNDIDAAAELIRKAEKLLCLQEYMAGKIRVKLFCTQVNILKQDYDSALISCNEGLELCKDEYPKLKGKLLTIRGNIFYQTGNVELAMERYEESLKYSKRVGYTKGALRSLNNIAVINMDNYQNYDKAIEYLMELKEMAEKGNFTESEMLASMNIGEINFINWRYEEALTWYMKALERAEKYNYESEIFYCYVILTNIYMMLNDYSSAYKYFSLATEELLNHPNQGRGLADYYRIGAGVFFEFGDIEKGFVFIDKALDIYDNEESVLKWSCQIMKLYMRLKEEENPEQAEEALLEITRHSAKFIDYKIRANIIYNGLLIVRESNLNNVGKSVLEDFKSDISEPRIKLKKDLLGIQSLKGKQKLAALNATLELAAKVKDKVSHWKVCCAIGDYYFDRQNYFYAVNFYFDACEIVRELVMSVPEKFRIDYFHSHNMQSPFYKLLEVRRHYYKTGISNKRVNSHSDLEQLFEYVDLRDILTNRHFIRSAQKIYDTVSGNKIKSIADLFGNIYSDSLRTLQAVIGFLARVTLAKQAFILLEEQGKDIKILAAASGELINLKSRYIIDRARLSKAPILLTEESLEYSYNDIQLIPAEVKAAICIPIIMSNESGQETVIEERRANMYSNFHITGYIYLESDKILNNFNEETFKVCKKLSAYVGSAIEKYQLRLSSSIDKLTGTFTRKFLEDILFEQVETAARNNQRFSIIMLDIDNFKGVNDKFGHQIGDKVLSKVCKVVLNSIRKMDSCGRYGGEEFIIILPDTGSEGAGIVAEKLRQAIEEAKALGDKREVTISLGIASYPQHGETSNELIEKADQALYVAKENGRNRWQVWQEEFSGTVKG